MSYAVKIAGINVGPLPHSAATVSRNAVTNAAKGIEGVNAAVTGVGYEAPTPIQARTIPALLAGRDVIGQAQTGTGKTAAFALPILQQLDLARAEVQALVLTPTRELAIQVAEAIHTYGKALGAVRVLPVYGGQGMHLQVKHLRGEVAGKRQAESPAAPWWCVDPEQYKAMHTDLGKWVDGVLAVQYGDYLTRLPRCLLSHRAAVWELSALRAEWERIYADPDNGDLQGLLAFQDRFLPGALSRLAAALADCKDNYCPLTRPR